jgi:AmiR/NasT family two-component response regulator
VSISSPSSRDLQAQVPALARDMAQWVEPAVGATGGVSTLTDAVLGRQVISQAVGIVMERFGLNSTRAFEYLVRTSQASQRKLRFVAAELVTRANERDDPGRQA